MMLEVVIHWLGHALKVGTITAETLPSRLKPALNAKADAPPTSGAVECRSQSSVSRLVRLLQRREHRALSAGLPAQAACRGTGWQLFAMLCGMVGYLAFHFGSSNEKSTRRAGVSVDSGCRAVLVPGLLESWRRWMNGSCRSAYRIEC